MDAPELGAFWGGAIGYFSYDAVRHLERIGEPPPRGVNAPDALFLLTGCVVIIDNLRAQARVVAPVVSPDASDEAACRAAWDEAQQEIDATVAALRSGPSLPPLELDPDRLKTHCVSAAHRFSSQSSAAARPTGRDRPCLLERETPEGPPSPQLRFSCRR